MRCSTGLVPTPSPAECRAWQAAFPPCPCWHSISTCRRGKRGLAEGGSWWPWTFQSRHYPVPRYGVERVDDFQRHRVPTPSRETMSGTHPDLRRSRRAASTLSESLRLLPRRIVSSGGPPDTVFGPGHFSPSAPRCRESTNTRHSFALCPAWFTAWTCHTLDCDWITRMKSCCCKPSSIFEINGRTLRRKYNK